MGRLAECLRSKKYLKRGITFFDFFIFPSFLHIFNKMGKKKNKEKKNSEVEKDLKKDVATDPSILKQELEVLIKNLNKQKNLQESFILRDEDVTEVDDGESSDDEIVTDK